MALPVDRLMSVVSLDSASLRLDNLAVLVKSSAWALQHIEDLRTLGLNKHTRGTMALPLNKTHPPSEPAGGNAGTWTS
jgi:hypothetical protein